MVSSMVGTLPSKNISLHMSLFHKGAIQSSSPLLQNYVFPYHKLPKYINKFSVHGFVVWYGYIMVMLHDCICIVGRRFLTPYFMKTLYVAYHPFFKFRSTPTLPHGLQPPPPQHIKGPIEWSPILTLPVMSYSSYMY